MSREIDTGVLSGQDHLSPRSGPICSLYGDFRGIPGHGEALTALVAASKSCGGTIPLVFSESLALAAPGPQDAVSGGLPPPCLIEKAPAGHLRAANGGPGPGPAGRPMTLGAGLPPLVPPGLRRWSGKLAAELPLLWLGAVADLAPPRECRCADAVVAATVGLSHLLVGGGPRRVGHGRFPTSVTRPSRLPAGAPKRPKRGSAVPVGGCFPAFAGERGVPPAPEAAGSRAWIPCRRRYSI